MITFYVFTVIGAHAFALDVLLLLTLPEELTFHVLLALPLLAERKRTLDVNLHPIKKLPLNWRYASLQASL